MLVDPEMLVVVVAAVSVVVVAVVTLMMMMMIGCPRSGEDDKFGPAHVGGNQFSFVGNL